MSLTQTKNTLSHPKQQPPKEQIAISPLNFTTDLKTQLRLLKNTSNVPTKEHTSPNNNDIIPVLSQFQQRLNNRKASVRSSMKKKRVIVFDENGTEQRDQVLMTPADINQKWKALGFNNPDDIIQLQKSSPSDLLQQMDSSDMTQLRGESRQKEPSFNQGMMYVRGSRSFSQPQTPAPQTNFGFTGTNFMPASGSNMQQTPDSKGLNLPATRRLLQTGANKYNRANQITTAIGEVKTLNGSFANTTSQFPNQFKDIQSYLNHLFPNKFQQTPSNDFQQSPNFMTLIKQNDRSLLMRPQTRVRTPGMLAAALNATSLISRQHDDGQSAFPQTQVPIIVVPQSPPPTRYAHTLPKNNPQPISINTTNVVLPAPIPDAHNPLPSQSSIHTNKSSTKQGGAQTQVKKKPRRQLISPVSLLNDYAIMIKERNIFKELKGDKHLTGKHKYQIRMGQLNQSNGILGNPIEEVDSINPLINNDQEEEHKDELGFEKSKSSINKEGENYQVRVIEQIEQQQESINDQELEVVVDEKME